MSSCRLYSMSSCRLYSIADNVWGQILFHLSQQITKGIQWNKQSFSLFHGRSFYLVKCLITRMWRYPGCLAGNCCTFTTLTFSVSANSNLISPSENSSPEFLLCASLSIMLCQKLIVIMPTKIHKINNLVLMFFLFLDGISTNHHIILFLHYL